MLDRDKLRALQLTAQRDIRDLTIRLERIGLRRETPAGRIVWALVEASKASAMVDACLDILEGRIELVNRAMDAGTSDVVHAVTSSLLDEMLTAHGGEK